MIYGTTAFGAGTFGSGSPTTPILSISATPSLSTASVALNVAGLDLDQFITILRQTPDGKQTPVRGANLRATYAGPGYTLGPNLLSANDSSFESTTGGWGAGSNVSSIAVSTDYAYVGTHSLKVTSTAAGTAHPYTQFSTIAVTPGQVYKFSFWIYTTQSNRLSTIEVDWNDSSGSFVDYDDLTRQGMTFPTLAQNAWTQVSIVTTAPAGAAYALLFGEPIAQTAGDVFYLDDVYFGTYTFTGVVAGTFAITDYECPLNTNVTYLAQAGTTTVDGVPVVTATATSNSVDLDTAEGTVWLKNLSVPSLNMQTNLSTVSDVSRVAKQQTNYVIGRANPVILSDVLAGRSGTLTFLTYDLATRTQLLGILTSSASSTLFLQVCAADGFEDLYFVISGPPVEKRPAGSSTDPTRLWDVPFIEVDSPADGFTQVGANTWLNVLGWSSWQAVLNQRPNWLSVLVAPFGSLPGDASS